MYKARDTRSGFILVRKQGQIDWYIIQPGFYNLGNKDIYLSEKKKHV